MFERIALSPDFIIRERFPGDPSLDQAIKEAIGHADTPQEASHIAVMTEFYRPPSEASALYSRILAHLASLPILSPPPASSHHPPLDTLAWMACGLIRSSLRSEDWRTAARTLALLHRLPPTSYKGSVHGTRGLTARYLRALAPKMQKHAHHSAHLAGRFAAAEAQGDTTAASSGPGDGCSLEDPSKPLPACTSFPIRAAFPSQAADGADPPPAAEPLRCSSARCIGPYCELTNVCVTGSDKVVYHHCGDAPPPEVLLARHPGRHRLLHTHDVEVVSGVPDAAYPTLGGTTMWVSAHSTLGHFVEHASKLLGLRTAFQRGDPVDRVVLLQQYWRLGYSTPQDAACEMLRVAFQREGFVAPPVYGVDALRGLDSAMCMRRVVFAAVGLGNDTSASTEYFASREDARAFRAAAWQMCGIPPGFSVGKAAQSVLWLQRKQPSRQGHVRRLLNIEELCRFSRWAYSIDAAAVQSDAMPFCQRVSWAEQSDVIVGMHSSHMVVEMMFAREGTVVVDLNTLHWRMPGLKSLMHQCGLVVLEFLTLDKSLTRARDGPLLRDEEFEAQNWWGCSYSLSQCQNYYKERSLTVPIQHVHSYINTALVASNVARGNGAPGEVISKECQQPEGESKYWREGLPPMWNWRVCEPADGGRCWRSISCSMAYNPGGSFDIYSRGRAREAGAAADAQGGGGGGAASDTGDGVGDAGAERGCVLGAVVTATSSAYLAALQNLVGSIHVHEGDLPIVIYSLDLSPEHQRILSQWKNVVVRPFDTSRYPPHVANFSNYGFKAAVIEESLDRVANGTCVLWLDAGIEVRTALEGLKGELARDGYWMIAATRGSHGFHPLRTMVAKGTYESLGMEPECMRDKFQLAAGMQAWSRGGDAYEQVFMPWLDCSLREECIAPEGANSNNHRYDQSALSVIFHEINQVRSVGGKALLRCKQDPLYWVSFSMLSPKMKEVFDNPRSVVAGNVFVARRSKIPKPFAEFVQVA